LQYKTTKHQTKKKEKRKTEHGSHKIGRFQNTLWNAAVKDSLMGNKIKYVQETI
jgi:hypothetical protein